MTILSRHAHAIRDVLDFPDAVCRLIGQFSATDIGYDPGDLFVRCGTWGGSWCKYTRRIPYARPPPPLELGLVTRIIGFQQSRRVIGQIFKVYKVERVTACQVTATLLKSYHAYQRYHPLQGGLWPEEQEVNAAHTEMLFVEQHPYARKNEYRFRIKKSDEIDMSQFLRLDLSTAIPCTGTIRHGIINGVGRLYTDYDNKTLFIKET